MNNATAHVKAAVTPDFDQIVNDFAALRRDFAELMKHVNNSAVHGAGDAADAVRDSIGQLGDKTRQVYDAASAQGARSVKAIGQQVEERPLTSLLIAFGVGIVASRLLSR